MSDIMPSLQRYVKEKEIKLVILDSISRAGMGDLTENQPVNRIMDALNGLCDSWIALGHAPRHDENHVFGGIHFDACADVVVQLLTQEGDGCLGVGLQSIKQNDIPKSPLQIFAYHFDDGGLCRVESATAGQFPEIEGKRKMTMEQAVRSYVLDVGIASAADAADATGFNRQNVSSLLNDKSKFVMVKKQGRTPLFGVCVDRGTS